MAKKKPDYSPAGLSRTVASWKRAAKKKIAQLKPVLGRGDPCTLAEPLAVALSGLKSGATLLEFTLDRYWHERMPAMLKVLDKAYDAAVTKGWKDRESALCWGTDNRLWVEATEPFKEYPDLNLVTKYRVLVHETQSRDYLYVWDENAPPPVPGRMSFRELHCRRIYRRWQDYYDPADKHDREEEQAFKAGFQKHGRYYAIVKCGHLIEEYADDERGDSFDPDRPSLAFYRAKKFEMRYGDARDPGYVFSWQESARKVGDAIHNHRLLSRIEDCFLPNIDYVLDHPEEDE